MRESNLELNKLVEICRIVEVTHSQAHVILNNSSVNPDYNIDEIRRQSSNNKKSQKESPELIKKRKFCSFSHKRGSCPAYGKLGNNCKKNNHFAICCNVKTVHKHQDSSESDENSKIFENEALFIGAISNEDFTPFDNDDNKWTAHLEVNSTLISFKIDTDAEANVMLFRVFLNLQNYPKLQPSKFRLSAYNGTNIPVKGCCVLCITHSITSTPLLFHVVENDSPSVLGLKTIKNLDLIRRIMKINSCVPDYLQQYTDCFDKIGCLKEKHCIIVDREVPPVINPPRCIPASLKMRLNEELNRMVKVEVITSIEEPTDWVSSLVIVEKLNGQLQICLDP